MILQRLLLDTVCVRVSGFRCMQNSDPPLAVGPGSTRSSYTVFAILFCGSSISQYLAQLSYNATAAKLTYVKRTHVSPVTYGPQHTPKTVRPLCCAGGFTLINLVRPHKVRRVSEATEKRTLELDGLTAFSERGRLDVPAALSQVDSQTGSSV